MDDRWIFAWFDDAGGLVEPVVEGATATGGLEDLFRAGEGPLVFRTTDGELDGYVTLVDRPVALNFRAGALRKVRLAAAAEASVRAAQVRGRNGSGKLWTLKRFLTYPHLPARFALSIRWSRVSI